MDVCLWKEENKNATKRVNSGVFKHAVNMCELQVETLLGFSSGLKAHVIRLCYGLAWYYLLPTQ